MSGTAEVRSGFRKGVRPNPKKDIAARRIRPWQRGEAHPAQRFRLAPKTNAPCAECGDNERINGSKRCEKCIKKGLKRKK